MLINEDLINWHRPSTDVLFESVTHQEKQNAKGIILTWMVIYNYKPLLKMRQMGADTYTQDEASSIVWGILGTAVKIEVVPPSNVKNLSLKNSIIP